MCDLSLLTRKSDFFLLFFIDKVKSALQICACTCIFEHDTALVAFASLQSPNKSVQRSGRFIVKELDEIPILFEVPLTLSVK